MTENETSSPGFRIVEDVVSAEECDALVQRLSDSQVSRGRAGARHLMALPEVARLACGERLMNIARLELRAEPFPFRVTLFEKSGNANWLVVWHQDTALPLKTRFEADGWGPWSEKSGVVYAHAPTWALSRVWALRVHLDASTIDNGPLRVIPSSHRLGVLTDEEVTGVARRRRFIECVVPKGGILTMSPLIIHSSSKARIDALRRVLHIEYADSQSLGPGIELAVA